MAASGVYASDSKLVEDLCQKVEDALAENKHQQVLELCKKGLLLDNKNAYFNYAIGRCHFLLGKHNDAFKFFQIAKGFAQKRGLQGADWEIFKYLGLCYLEGKGVQYSSSEAKTHFHGAIDCANIYLEALTSTMNLHEIRFLEQEISILTIYSNNTSDATEDQTLVYSFDSLESSDEDSSIEEFVEIPVPSSHRASKKREMQ